MKHTTQKAGLLLTALFFSTEFARAQTTFGTGAGTLGGSDCSFYGFNAGNANSATGFSNTFIGGTAGRINTTGIRSTIVGTSAGYNSNGSNSVMVGYAAGYSNTSGTNNTFTGISAGFANTTGVQNAFFGDFAGSSNTTGGYNTIVGSNSGSVTTGSFNTVLGYNAYVATAGNDNTSLGRLAGIKDGSSTCLAVGSRARVEDNLTNATAIGPNAVVSLSNSISLGSNTNVSIGHSDPYKRLSVRTTTNNDGIRVTQGNTGSGYAGVELNNETTSGRNWGLLSLGNGNSQGSGNFLVHNFTSNLEAIFINGANNYVGIGNTAPGVFRLNVNGNTYTSGSYSSSDIRFKKDVQSIEHPLELIKALKGVRYTFRDDMFLPQPQNSESAPQKRVFPQGRQIGLIAQEVEQVVPEVVVTNEDGYKSIAYQNLVSVLIEGMKEQQQQIEQKDAVLSQLQKTVEELADRVRELEKEPTHVGSNGSEERAYLDQNAPNPFSDKTIIGYYIPAGLQGNASIEICNIEGRQVKSISITQRGQGQVTIDGNALPAGNYLFSLQVNGRKVDTRKMILTR